VNLGLPACSSVGLIRKDIALADAISVATSLATPPEPARRTLAQLEIR
jgi:hypothetical protein